MEVFLALVFLVILFGAPVLVVFLWIKNKKLARRNDPISNAEDEVARIRREFSSEKSQLERDISQLRQSHTSLLEQVNTTTQKLERLRLDEIAQDFGLYEPKYDFQDSQEYKNTLERIREKQKNLIRDGKAVVCPVSWTVGNSRRQGDKMVKEIMQLMLIAFNTECENLILKVKFDNVLSIEDRIKKLFNKINTLDGETQSHITNEYLNLKLEELHLCYGYQQKKQQEAEEQRAIREQMREEEKALRELEKARLDAEKEEERYQKALEKARQEAQNTEGAKHQRLLEQIQGLEAALLEAHARKERAISQAQLTRSGHVYVISNIGSFGKDVYKIGMTRRLEPMDRVRELGDASVPFQFDVHAIIYSEDAPKLENELHRVFANKRLNLVNLKKEFFHVTLGEIQEIVLKNHGHIQFTLSAEAQEWRLSEQQRKQPVLN